MDSTDSRAFDRSADVPDRVADARILLVEDDHGDAVLVQAALDEAGVPDSAVVWTRSLGEALDALAAAPDCVLLDLGLPDSEGYGAVHKMVEAAPDVAVIVLTGRQERDGLDALAAGAQDYLVKDAITAELLERSIRYAIERKRAQHAQQRLREMSLSAAEQARLERGLLPRPLLTTDGVRCATHYRPGRDDAVLGGDFFDVVEPRPGVVRAVIGDVMGHGPDEAALGVHLRVGWRSLLLSGIPDDEMLPALGRLLDAEEARGTHFATVCDLTLADGTLTLRVAGHPAPVLSRDGTAEYLPVAVGVPLGVRAANVPDRGWQETRVPLPAGASVLLYTDGLLDAFTTDHTLGSIGVDELVTAVRARPVDATSAQDWIAALLAAAPRVPIDDTAVVVLTIS
ncbi:Response regulator receiver domain-containing protein [Jatrophihabitans endophyticus]|uniref:Response regulator receiver domain-containing protein n=1 Tax=Jatrophihabitans endophyticus TaxID=1206085 RepID=A0A1M5H734_9ACTN|nr:SpoIIE family protein phosphatase [Jatrophihabitans endophyticus]SHG11819.1 Response regulator receiver domain-containing protein [Jatrophihabitans endophyticus]